MATPLELKAKYNPSWCPGCGNYGILNGIKQAISQSGFAPHEVVIVSGIGCSGKDPHFVNTYGFEGIHGRVLPVATAIKLANHKLKVIGCAGDGDAYGIGAAHFVHALRRNIGITYFVHNNQIYGLTTGQTSPTSDKGFTTKSTPGGVIEEPFNPLALAIAGGATFVARAFVGEFDQMKEIMAKALLHKGFALVDIFQPCVTFNYKNTYQWYQERAYKLEDEAGYDSHDKELAFKKAVENSGKLPIGVFYQEERAAYEESVAAIKERPLIDQEITNIGIKKTLEEFL
ncbi:MAG: 2-oxoacid:ferredoxin oxidoreductase subunit beta [Candidatus Omnitrophota bacterium]